MIYFSDNRPRSLCGESSRSNSLRASSRRAPQGVIGRRTDDAYPYRARQEVGPDRVVGVTCGDSRHRALVAAEAGADYVAFGAFFPSGTKAGAKYRATPEVLRDWSDMTVVPCCAIGGITQENCRPLVEAGADFLAVIGAIWGYPKGPKQAVADFNAVFARYGRAHKA